MCFSQWKNIEFQYNQRNLAIASITASQQPLFVVPEHMTHPVIRGINPVKYVLIDMQTMQRNGTKYDKLEKLTTHPHPLPLKKAVGI